MKHLKRFAACCAAAVCCAAMLLLATGCQQQQESYTPPEATPAVSKPVIAQEGVLRVGVNANNAPLAGSPPLPRRSSASTSTWRLLWPTSSA